MGDCLSESTRLETLRMNLLVFVSRIRKWLDVGLVNNRRVNFGVKPDWQTQSHNLRISKST